MNAAGGKFPQLDPLDRRLAAFRPDLADIRLKGQVEAARFVEGKAAMVSAPVCDLRERPDPACPLDHQLLLGAPVRTFEKKGEWIWLQSETDRYVGWASARAIVDGRFEPTHIVSVPRTFSYPGPDMKFPVTNALSMGSAVRVVAETETRSTKFMILENGEALIARHLRPLAQNETDYVNVAERFLTTPYLWGGSSGFGLDCSGLIQLAMRMCGVDVLRDSDMQAATIGTPIEAGEDYRNLQRGDLVFWRGHIAIYDGQGNLLHANGYTMDVAREPLMTALGRIATLFEKPIGYRRP